MPRAAGRLRPPPHAPEGHRRGANYPGAYGAAPQSPWSRTGDSASSDNSWVSDLDGEINSGVGAHRSALTCARGSTFVDGVLSSLGTHRKPSRRRCGLAGCPIHASPILGRNGGRFERRVLRRRMNPRAREDGMPVRGRSGDGSSAVSFNAGSRAADDPHPHRTGVARDQDFRESEPPLEGVLELNFAASATPGRQRRLQTRGHARALIGRY